MKRPTTILLPLSVIAFSMLLVSGCATVTKGTDQEVTVTTDPEGARCTLTREGAILAVIDPTPGTITVQKSKKNASVSCELAEYKDSSGMLESKFSDMTLGNVLFGGIVGIAIDASSGASRQYDPVITLTMIPERFLTEDSRDVFFDKMRDDFIRDSEKSMKLIAQKCTPDTCEFEKKEAEKAKTTRLAEIERERQVAMIGEMGKSETSAGAEEPSKSAKETVAMVSTASQTPVADELIGNWGGEIAQCAACSPAQLELRITSKNSRSYTGDVLKLNLTGCKGSGIKLNPGTGNAYSMTFHSDTQCDAKGTLEHSGKTLNGKIRFKRWPGLYTVNLSKLSGEF